MGKVICREHILTSSKQKKCYLKLSFVNRVEEEITANIYANKDAMQRI